MALVTANIVGLARPETIRYRLQRADSVANIGGGALMVGIDFERETMERMIDEDTRD